MNKDFLVFCSYSYIYYDCEVFEEIKYQIFFKKGRHLLYLEVNPLFIAFFRPWTFY